MKRLVGIVAPVLSAACLLSAVSAYEIEAVADNRIRINAAGSFYTIGDTTDSGYDQFIQLEASWLMGDDWMMQGWFPMTGIGAVVRTSSDEYDAATNIPADWQLNHYGIRAYLGARFEHQKWGLELLGHGGYGYVDMELEYGGVLSGTKWVEGETAWEIGGRTNITRRVGLRSEISVGVNWQFLIISQTDFGIEPQEWNVGINGGYTWRW